jgi:putative heme-binding domain-containing protein
MTGAAGIFRTGARRVGRISWSHAFALAGALILGVPTALGAEPGAPPNTAIALEALSRLKGIDLAANPAVRAAVQKVLQQVRGRPEFLEIVRDFQLLDQDPGLVEVAAKNPRDSSGVEAARLVVEHGSLELLREAFRGTNALSLIEALGHARVKESVPLLEPIVTDAGRDLALRQEATRALAQVREGAVGLLTLARENKLPTELKPTATAELNAVRWPELKDEAARALPLPQPLQSHTLPMVAELIKRRGDAARGSEVFRREIVGCVRCHQVNGQGIDFGPNLSEIGSKLGPDALYQAILEPSAGISFGYEAWQLEMKNGDEVYGLVTSETGEEVVVKALGGIVSRYKKSAIARRTQQKISVMPSGLDQAMSVEDLVDLVEYLGSLKKR